MSTSHEEKIICPNCQRIETATVDHTQPFNSYVHLCQCGYIIVESEWEKIEYKDDKFYFQYIELLNRANEFKKYIKY